MWAKMPVSDMVSSWCVCVVAPSFVMPCERRIGTTDIVFSAFTQPMTKTSWLARVESSGLAYCKMPVGLTVYVSDSQADLKVTASGESLVK